jgi:sugar phosphate isomerase/epimerase
LNIRGDGGPGNPPAIGIQLYTVQSELIRDFAGTLETLRHIGYRQVEPSGTLGRSPREFKDALDAAGLAVPSAHILSKAAQDAMVDMATGRLTVNDAWEKVGAAMDLANIEPILAEMFEQQSVLGNEYLVLAVLDSNLLRSRAGIDRVVQAFDKAGQLCHDRGLEFAWHPHLDYGKATEKSAFDRILEATDPTRVLVEIDFFWAAMSQADIPSLLQRYGDRLRLGHVKDMADSVVASPGGFTDINVLPYDIYADVGYGQIDYEALIPRAWQAGMRYFFVERDFTPHPIESARRSFSVLSNLVAMQRSDS